MIHKPITLAREDFIQAVCDTCNKADIPAFVKIDVLERVLNELRKVQETELKHDEAEFRAALQAQNTEQTDNKEEE